MRTEGVLALLLFSAYAQHVVNKRRQTEEKLHQSEEWFRSLVQLASFNKLPIPPKETRLCGPAEGRGGRGQRKSGLFPGVYPSVTGTRAPAPRRPFPRENATG